MAGATRQQQFTGFGQRHAAGGAVQQAHAQPLLELAQALAEARGGDDVLAGRAAEVFGARNGHEGGEVAIIDVGHCSI
jgi:hypothetical protein